MTKQEFAEVAKILRVAYERDGFLSTPEKMDFWYDYLKDFKAQTIKTIATEYIRRHKFQPTIADIFEPSDEYESRAKLEMFEVFQMAKGTYPCAKIEPGTMAAWNKITADDDWNGRVQKAKKLLDFIRRFIENHEVNHTIDDIPTFTEFLQGLANEP